MIMIVILNLMTSMISLVVSITAIKKKQSVDCLVDEYRKNNPPKII
mgnify:CR=1 FL=1